jgi:hypothetical protein
MADAGTHANIERLERVSIRVPTWAHAHGRGMRSGPLRACQPGCRRNQGSNAACVAGRSPDGFSRYTAARAFTRSGAVRSARSPAGAGRAAPGARRPVRASLKGLRPWGVPGAAAAAGAAGRRSAVAAAHARLGMRYSLRPARGLGQVRACWHAV